MHQIASGMEWMAGLHAVLEASQRWCSAAQAPAWPPALPWRKATTPDATRDTQHRKQCIHRFTVVRNSFHLSIVSGFTSGKADSVPLT